MCSLVLTKTFDNGHQVPTIKIPSAYHNTFIELFHCWCTIWYSTHWYCWPTSSSYGFNYLLTCIDWFTWWPEAIPIAAIMAETVARAFVGSWIGQFGIPSTLSTEWGRQFDLNFWCELMRLLGSKRIHTTAYHPSFNGLVEQFHRQLKA